MTKEDKKKVKEMLEELGSLLVTPDLYDKYFNDVVDDFLRAAGRLLETLEGKRAN